MIYSPCWPFSLQSFLLFLPKIRGWPPRGPSPRSTTAINRPLSCGGHFESQGNKKLCFCPSSLALDERLDGQNLLFQHCVIKFYLELRTLVVDSANPALIPEPKISDIFKLKTAEKLYNTSPANSVPSLVFPIRTFLFRRIIYYEIENMYRVSIELYKHKWKFGRTGNVWEHEP